METVIVPDGPCHFRTCMLRMTYGRFTPSCWLTCLTLYWYNDQRDGSCKPHHMEALCSKTKITVCHGVYMQALINCLSQIFILTLRYCSTTVHCRGNRNTPVNTIEGQLRCLKDQGLVFRCGNLYTTAARKCHVKKYMYRPDEIWLNTWQHWGDMK